MTLAIWRLPDFTKNLGLYSSGVVRISAWWYTMVECLHSSCKNIRMRELVMSLSSAVSRMVSKDQIHLLWHLCCWGCLEAQQLCCTGGVRAVKSLGKGLLTLSSCLAGCLSAKLNQAGPYCSGVLDNCSEFSPIKPVLYITTFFYAHQDPERQAPKALFWTSRSCDQIQSASYRMSASVRQFSYFISYFGGNEGHFTPH